MKIITFITALFFIALSSCAKEFPSIQEKIKSTIINYEIQTLEKGSKIDSIEIILIDTLTPKALSAIKYDAFTDRYLKKGNLYKSKVELLSLQAQLDIDVKQESKKLQKQISNLQDSLEYYQKLYEGETDSITFLNYMVVYKKTVTNKLNVQKTEEKGFFLTKDLKIKEEKEIFK